MRDRTEAFADSIGAEGDGFSVHFPKEERAVLDPLPDLSEIGIAGSDIHLKFVVEIREPVREKIDVSFCAPVEGSLDRKRRKDDIFTFIGEEMKTGIDPDPLSFTEFLEFGGEGMFCVVVITLCERISGLQYVPDLLCRIVRKVILCPDPYGIDRGGKSKDEGLVIRKDGIQRGAEDPGEKVECRKILFQKRGN